MRNRTKSIPLGVHKSDRYLGTSPTTQPLGWCGNNNVQGSEERWIHAGERTEVLCVYLMHLMQGSTPDRAHTDQSSRSLPTPMGKCSTACSSLHSTAITIGEETAIYIDIERYQVYGQTHVLSAQWPQRREWKNKCTFPRDDDEAVKLSTY